MRALKRIFDTWNDILNYCHQCGGETESYGHHYLDGHTLCEYGVRCQQCKANVAYWAYGGYDGPTTKTEAAYIWYLELKYKVQERMRTFP